MARPLLSLPKGAAPLAMILGLAMVACTKKSGPKPDSANVPEHPEAVAVTAQSSGVNLLTLAVDIPSDELRLHLSGVPEGATVECQLDDRPLPSCTDGASYPLPMAGTHRITAMAIKGGTIVALGESPSFAVAPLSVGATVGGGNAAPLQVMLADQAFTNGMIAPLSKDLAVRFQLVAKAPCPAPTIQCRLGLPETAMWSACDAGDQSFTVPAAVMAAGRQFLSVQAACADQFGPIFSVYWYGVPDNFQPLMLRELRDSAGRYVVNLVKADDCPVAEQKFFCASAAKPEFSACANVIDQPESGTRVHVVCGERTGPDLMLTPSPKVPVPVTATGTATAVTTATATATATATSTATDGAADVSP